MAPNFGTNPGGTNIGTFTAPVGDRTVSFNAAVVTGTSDNTPPEVGFITSSVGTITVGSIDPTNTFYPVTVSEMAYNSTNVIQVQGDNVDSCYLTVVIQPQNIEDFSVDPTTITFSP